MEKWIDIPGYEGLYQVSNLGRVKGMAKTVNFGHTKRKIEERFLTPSLSGNYLKVSLHNNGKGKTFRVHQLVAMAFLGHLPNGKDGITVDHINMDKLDNRPENLRLIHNRVNSSINRAKSTSKYVGVYWNKNYNKWVSAIRINGKKNVLGKFDCELKASYVYNMKLKEIGICV